MSEKYEVEIVITSYSMFDLLPNWAQWTIMGIAVTAPIALIVLIKMQEKGLLK